MEELIEVLEKELEELKKIEKAAEEDIKNAPQGTLRIAKNHNSDQYYWRTNPKDTQGKYIRKTEQTFIRSLAQKDYAQKVIKLLTPIIKNKKQELQKSRETDIHEQLKMLYTNLSPSRQKLITHYIDTPEQYIAKWEASKKKSPAPLSEIYTEKGECVRSKSEKILADKFYMMNIPYAYEVPLYLKGYGYIKPDFTVLNRRTRREYFWEHLGMMDDKEYCEKAIKKIETFEKNSIFPGENLILTYETKEHPLNMKVVEKVIEKYLS